MVVTITLVLVLQPFFYEKFSILQTDTYLLVTQILVMRKQYNRIQVLHVKVMFILRISYLKKTCLSSFLTNERLALNQCPGKETTIMSEINYKSLMSPIYLPLKDPQQEDTVLVRKNKNYLMMIKAAAGHSNYFRFSVTIKSQWMLPRLMPHSHSQQSWFFFLIYANKPCRHQIALSVHTRVTVSL